MIKIVLIEWVDAQSLNPQIPLTDIEELRDLKPILAKTVGFLIAENEECYIIGDEYWEEANEVRWIHIIPKCCVKKVKFLKGV